MPSLASVVTSHAARHQRRAHGRRSTPARLAPLALHRSRTAAAAWSRWPAIPTEPMTFYFGACAGGVWKTTDGGLYWENVSDGFFRPRPVGALAVAPSDAERDLRRHRRGVHPRQRLARRRRLPVRPTAATPGPTSACATPATSAGCASTRTIPTSSTSRRSATPGARTASAASSARATAARTGSTCSSRASGRARSTSRWTRTTRASCYAAIWEAQRTPVGHEQRRARSGAVEVDRRRRHAGPTSRASPACRAACSGEIGVAVSPAEAAASGRWSRPRTARSSAPTTAARPGSAASEQAGLRGRPWYYMHVFADPRDADTVWVLNYSLWKSIDGGKTFAEVPTPHGDNHDLWIDPAQPAADDRGQRRRRAASRSTAASRGRRSTTSRPRSSTTSPPTTSARTGSTARSRTTRRSACRASRHRGAITGDRLGRARRRRERLHRGQAGRPRHRRRRRPSAAARAWADSSATTTGRGRSASSPSGRRSTAWASRRAEHRYRFQWTFPIVLLALGPARAVDRGQPRLPLDRRGARAGRSSAPT